MPHDLGWPVQEASPAPCPAPPPELEAKVENFFWSFFDPHLGHGVPSQPAERTRTSESPPHFPQ